MTPISSIYTRSAQMSRATTPVHSPKTEYNSPFQNYQHWITTQDITFLVSQELKKLGAAGADGSPHPEQVQERMNALAKEISDRGYFKSKGEADWLYQNNTDPTLRVEVDASKLTVDISQGSGWYDDNHLGGQNAWGEVGGGSAFNTDFLVHGTVKVNQNDHALKVLPEQYNFEMKPWSTHPLRNIKTLLAEPSRIGTPFWIDYRGIPNVQ